MKDFRFTIPYKVRVADVNYGGHVANSAVLNFFQDARIEYLAQLGHFNELDIGGCGIILPEAQIKYKAEMFLGDDLEIGVRVTEIGRSSLVMEYRIERGGDEMATGTTNLVAFDYAARRPRRIGEEFRRAVCEFEGL